MDRFIFFILISSLTFSSCFREDTLLPAYQGNPEVKQSSIALAEKDENTGAVVFKNQVFFELETGITQTVKRDSWDLGFEAGSEGYHIMLNSANYMQAVNAGLIAFGAVREEVDMANYSFDFDASSGNLDSTIIGEWLDREKGLSKQEVFFINRGIDGSLAERGYVKFQLLSLKNDTISFVYSDLNNENTQNVQLYVGNNDRNFVFFSFETNTTVEVEPAKEDWDLSFSYYSYRYEDGMPYWLTGALTNRHKVRSAFVDDHSILFENLTLEDTSRVEFTKAIDEIGFDWKEYLFGPPARYVVYSEKIYLVKDTRGIYYKLRFLDFYNDLGERGFPRFEYAELF